MKPEQFESPGEFRNCWYAPTSEHCDAEYLHTDGVIRVSTENEATGEFTGFFKTKEAAEEAIQKYEASIKGDTSREE